MRPTSPNPLHGGLAALLLAVMPSALPAAQVNYDGGPSATGTNWADAVNWSGDTLPGTGDIAGFITASTNLTINVGASRTVQQINFSGSNAPYTIGSAADVLADYALTLQTVRRDANTGGIQTIATDIVLGATNTVFDILTGFNNHLQLTGNISGSNNLVKYGSGTLMLGAANSYTGSTIIRQGTLTLNFNLGTSPTSNIVDSSSLLSLGGGNLSLTGKNGATTSQTFANTTFTAGGSGFSIVNGNTANTRTLLNLGAITRSTGSTVSFTQPTGTGNTTIGATNGYATSTANDASGILGAYATSGTEWATNNGTNIVDYTGYTDLAGAGPTLNNAATTNFRITSGSTGAVGQGAGTTTVNTLRINDAAAREITVGSGNTLRVNGILATGTGGLTIGASGNGGTLTAGSADNTGAELIINNSTAVTVNSVIANNGTGAVALTKTGAGTLTLTDAATHTGGTFINGGTLQLGAGTDRLVSTADITISGGTLNLGTSTQNLSGALSVLGGTISNGTITKTGADYDVQSGTVSAILGGSVGLVKTSLGTVTLSGNNTYTGTTTVLEGRLNATVSGAIDGNIVVGSEFGTQEAVFSGSDNVDAVPHGGSATVTVYRNGAFLLGNGDHMNNLVIIGGRANSNNGYLDSGTIKMTGGSVSGAIYGNFTTVETLANATTASITAGLATTGSSRKFIVADGAAANDLQVSGAIEGSSFAKEGDGTMYVGGAKAYTGAVTITAGTLAVDNLADGGANSGLGKSSNAAGNLVLRNNATLRYVGSGHSTDRQMTIGLSTSGASAASLDASGTGAVNFTNTAAIAYGTTGHARTITLTGTSTANNTLAAAINNNGAGIVSLAKTGTGTWILSAAEGYTGATTVTGGTLVVNGSLHASSAVTVGAGGKIGGTGTINGAMNVQAGGALAPGNSAGILNQVGNLTLESDSFVNFELFDQTDLIGDRGVKFDGVNTTGASLLTLQTGVTLNVVLNSQDSLVNFNDVFWDQGHSWVLFSNVNTPSIASLNVFDGINVSADASGNAFTPTTGGEFTASVVGNNVVLTYALIPEPGTVILLGAAAGVVLLRRRRGC